MFIEKTELFEGMSAELMDKVNQALEVKSWPEGEFIFHRGDPAEYLCILEEGRVRLTVGDAGTVSRTVRTPGDVFGWSSLIGFGHYTATAQCLTQVVVARISGARMSDLLAGDPEDGLLFYRRLAGIIARRLTDTYRVLLTYDAEKRPHSYG